MQLIQEIKYYMKLKRKRNKKKTLRKMIIIRFKTR